MCVCVTVTRCWILWDSVEMTRMRLGEGEVGKERVGKERVEGTVWR